MTEGRCASAENGGFIFWTETATSNPYRPPEILDHIIDIIHDKPDTLKKCYLVSKSRFPRTRKQAFGMIRTLSSGHLESRQAFPDPSNSHVYHIHTLWVCCLPYPVTILALVFVDVEMEGTCFADR